MCCMLHFIINSFHTPMLIAAYTLISSHEQGHWFQFVSSLSHVRGYNVSAVAFHAEPCCRTSLNERTHVWWFYWKQASNSDAPHTAFTQLSHAEIMSSPGSDQMDEAIVRMLGAIGGDQVGIDPDFLFYRIFFPPNSTYPAPTFSTCSSHLHCCMRCSVMSINGPM